MYRTVDTRFWSDPKVRDLKPPDKLLFLYLITNPHTHPSGIYYLPQPTIVHETGLTVSQLRCPTDTLSGAGFIRYDDVSEVVWVRNMFRYQGAGEKMRLAAGRQLATLHKSLLIKEFLAHYPDVSIPYRDPIPRARARTGTGTGTGTGTEERPPLPPKKKLETKPRLAVWEQACAAMKTDALKTDTFRAAWESWVEDRKDRHKPMTGRGVKIQIRKLEKWGHDQAVTAIENSIAAGWQGLFEPGRRGPGATPSTSDARPRAAPGKYNGIGTTGSAFDYPGGKDYTGRTEKDGAGKP